MKRSSSAALSLALVATLFSSQAAIAGPYADDLAKCLVSSTTDADKTVLVEWIFALATLHPDVAPLANISTKQRTELSKSAAELSQRLMTETCKEQTVKALQYEGSSTLEFGFGVLGQVAMRGLFSDPNVARGMAEYGTYIDKDRMKAALDPASKP